MRTKFFVSVNCPDCGFPMQMRRVEERSAEACLPPVIRCEYRKCSLYGRLFEAPVVSLKPAYDEGGLE